MKNTQEWGKGKIPDVIIDPEMDKYKGKVMFPEKLEQANKELKGIKIPLPKQGS